MEVPSEIIVYASVQDELSSSYQQRLQHGGDEQNNEHDDADSNSHRKRRGCSIDEYDDMEQTHRNMKRRRVQFESKTEVIGIDPWATSAPSADRTNDEDGTAAPTDTIQDRWISRRELQRSQFELVKVIKAIRASSQSNIIQDDDTFSLRGMETMLEDWLHNKQGRGGRSASNKRQAIRAVLKVQSIQRNLEHQNPEILAKIYRSYAEESMHVALRRAIQDQRDVWAQQGYKVGTNVVVDD